MSKAKIYYHDIGDYLTHEEKLAIIKKNRSIAGMQWQVLSPNEHNDWINLRNDSFGEFIPLAPEKKFDARAQSFFLANIVGVATGRDAWVLNFSKEKLADNMQRMIDFYNEQSKAFAETENPNLEVEKFIDMNPAKISWTRALRNDIKKSVKHSHNNNAYYECLYRPFTKEWFYYDKSFIESPGLWQQIFPSEKHKNLAICVINVGSQKEFSTIISDKISEYQLMFANQCFPLYYYEETKQEKTLFDSLAEPESGYYARRDGISDFILTQALKIYGSKTTKEDIFYYVYAFLHNPDYRTLYAADLKKMLPRLPLIGDSSNFWRYVKAGRELADLHLHYEDYAHEAAGVVVEINNAVYDNYEVTKMRFPSKEDKSRIIYNPYITLTNIPAEAYEYIINGKPAIEWIMERYQISTHKESGIVNDPNDWAREQGKPKYILDLLLSIIAVSVKTVEIVKALPKVKFEIR
ncbi:MAG: hypothetical protein LBS55_08670 [Prevotellaceae bacterium]|jgi:predicted helicase|nr:hypothetical protein [Prevotellaceae bacterium]